jgi:hypothetical protein
MSCPLGERSITVEGVPDQLQPSILLKPPQHPPYQTATSSPKVWPCHPPALHKAHNVTHSSTQVHCLWPVATSSHWVCAVVDPYAGTCSRVVSARTKDTPPSILITGSPKISIHACTVLKTWIPAHDGAASHTARHSCKSVKLSALSAGDCVPRSPPFASQ